MILSKQFQRMLFAIMFVALANSAEAKEQIDLRSEAFLYNFKAGEAILHLEQIGNSIETCLYFNEVNLRANDGCVHQSKKENLFDVQYEDLSTAKFLLGKKQFKKIRKSKSIYLTMDSHDLEFPDKDPTMYSYGHNDESQVDAFYLTSKDGNYEIWIKNDKQKPLILGFRSKAVNFFMMDVFQVDLG